MNAKDLQLGDYVTYISGEHCSVRELNRKGLIAVSFIDAKGKMQYSTLLPERDFEPIPLTREILEKNGFQKISTNKYVSGKVTIAVFAEEFLITIKSENARVMITTKYVHELQHIFRLCGINKENKL